MVRVHGFYDDRYWLILELIDCTTKLVYLIFLDDNLSYISFGVVQNIELLVKTGNFAPPIFIAFWTKLSLVQNAITQ